MSAVSREAYLETGLEILSDCGYGGLKLAELCTRLGVTTGSFYHFFTNWPTFTRELVEYWRHGRTTQLVERIQAEPNPRRRIDLIIDIGLHLPHSAEAAIRAWSGADPWVHQVQAEVDKQRHEIALQSAMEILHHERQAELFAQWAVYLLVGYEQSTLPQDRAALEWIVGQLLEALDGGRFTTAPAD